VGLGVYATVKVVGAAKRGVERTVTQARRTVEDASLRAKSFGQLGPAGAVALLRPAGDAPPRVVGGPDAVQRVAGALRAGLRKATDGLAPDARALLPGLVVGDTSRVPDDLHDAFRATDLLHLLAVSGSNLTVVLFLLIGPPGRAQRSERRGLAPRLGLSLRATAVGGALLTLAFVVVCRPDPSVLRAAACGAVTLLAIATGRRRSLVPALAAAVVLLVLYDPWLARSPGFLLSVLATGALLLLAPRWSAALQRRGMPARPAEALAAAAAAQAVCAPVVAVLSARVSLVGIPCNLLAELAAGPATVLGFAVLAAAPVSGPAAELLARCAGVPAGWIALVARTGARLPGAELSWPGGVAGGLLLAAVTVLALWCAGRAGRRRGLGAASALLLLVAVLRPPQLTRMVTAWPPPDWNYVQCAVGQGDAGVLSVGPGTAVVVDAGPEPEPVDACLRTLGVRTVPMLLLTHFHADHVGGLSGVLRGRSVGLIQTTALAEPPFRAAQVRRAAAAAGVPVVAARAGERRRAGPVQWQVLWPPPGLTGAGPNDASVALLVRTAGPTLLLLGDLEPDAQQALLREHPELGPVDVLKVAHHGSAHQDPGLYARTRPRVAIVPVGTGNRYGHPAPGTLALLRAGGAAVLRTDTDGSVAVLGAGPGTRAVPAGRRGRRHAGRGTPDSVCSRPGAMIECVFARRARRGARVHTARGCINHVRSPTGDTDGRKQQSTDLRDTHAAAHGEAAQLPGARHGPPAGPAGHVRGDGPDRPPDRQRRDGPVRRVHRGGPGGGVPADGHRGGLRALPRGDAGRRRSPGGHRGDRARPGGAAAAAAARPLGDRSGPLGHRLLGAPHRSGPDPRPVQHVRGRGPDRRTHGGVLHARDHRRGEHRHRPADARRPPAVGRLPGRGPPPDRGVLQRALHPPQRRALDRGRGPDPARGQPFGDPGHRVPRRRHGHGGRAAGGGPGHHRTPPRGLHLELAVHAGPGHRGDRFERRGPAGRADPPQGVGVGAGSGPTPLAGPCAPGRPGFGAQDSRLRRAGRPGPA
ncbi:MBL fold metallo-hydrolase, partial [Streptomyces bambusae]|nr:MBL fold metallo-hydrolase [Streptomyces bambusae]